MSETDYSHVGTRGRAFRGRLPRSQPATWELKKCERCGNDIPRYAPCGKLVWRTRYNKMKFCSKACRWPGTAPDVHHPREPKLAVPTAPLLALIAARIEEYGYDEWWRRCDMPPRSFHRMARTKYITLYTADRWCGALGKHLTEVYGREDLGEVA